MEGSSLPEHSRGLTEEFEAPAATLGSCAICLGRLCRPVELACGHQYCYTCLSTASATEYRCPQCRTVHILDPEMLKARRDSFRQGYRAWRMGEAVGAVGEVSDIPVVHSMATSGDLHSEPIATTGELHSEMAGSIPQTGTMAKRRRDQDLATVVEEGPPLAPLGSGPPVAVADSGPCPMPVEEERSAVFPQPTPELDRALTGSMALEDSNSVSSIAEVLTMMQSSADVPDEPAAAAMPVPQPLSASTAAAVEAAQPPPAAAAAAATAAAESSGSSGKYPKRRRKSSQALKEQMTGILYVLCQCPLVTCIEAVDSSKLPSYGVKDSAQRFAVLVKFGTTPNLMKEQISLAVAALLSAFDSQKREPLKWDTLQRDILWKYQRRIQSDSLYLYEEPGTTHNRETIARYGQRVLAGIAPRTVDEVLLASLDASATTPGADGAANPAGAPPGAPLGASLWLGSGSALCAPPAEQLEAEALARAPPSQRARLRCKVAGCGYKTAHQRYLDQHMRTHSGLKPYECHWPGCDYACSGKGHLVRHIRVHTGEKPYKCTWPGCSYAATQSGHLKAHLRKHESKALAVSAAATAVPTTAWAAGPVAAAATAAAAVGAFAAPAMHTETTSVLMMQQAPPAGSSTLPVIQEEGGGAAAAAGGHANGRTVI